MTSAQEVLGRKTAKGAAQAFTEWLKENAAQKLLGKPGELWGTVFLWSPDEAKARGYGNGWAVCWEQGPFQWTMAVSGGSSLFAGETGNYSALGPFPEGIYSAHWHCEPHNGFILSFYQD